MDMFFCDIRGTYSGNENKREQVLKEFSKNLSFLVDQSKSKKLIFSFVSSDDANYVNDCITELKQYITDPRIIFGYNYSFDKKTKHNEVPIACNNGKVIQMFEEINTKEEIDTIYFADDTIFYHTMLEYFYCKKQHNAKKLVHFIPGTSDQELSNDFSNLCASILMGIDGLNLCIEEELIKEKNQSKKKINKLVIL